MAEGRRNGIIGRRSISALLLTSLQGHGREGYGYGLVVLAAWQPAANSQARVSVQVR